MLEPGTRLAERYRLGPEIGRGGMAIVYRARDELLDRDVAIKVVRKPDLTSDDRQRLLHEARLAARLNHPHIVTVYDAGEVDGEPYIVMELVEGQSLFGHPPANLTETVTIASQLCEALAHAHQQGIVHRDLKPENILRTGQGAVKLTDFGLALSLASRVTHEGVIAGTVFYLAPEQLQGLDVDGRTDLYALGILLYEWTTGGLPFTAPETLGVITQHLYASVVAPRAKVPDLPPALDRLIVQLLSKSPDDRPASALEVLETLHSPDLMNAEGGEPDVPLLERIGRGRMAGRQAELGVARGLWAQAAAGRSQTLLVSGEPGIGKTRLVREIVALAEVSRGRVLQGWNYAQAAEPFGAFRQILRTAFDDMAATVRTAPDFIAAAVLSIAPEYHPYFPNLVLKESVDTAEEQQRHFEGAAVLLSMLSEQAPVLLVVEDAHWADSGTLRLFRYLVQQTRGRRVMFMLTFRDVEPAEAPLLHEVLHDFRRERLAVPLALGRLDRAKTEDMLTALLGESAAPELVDNIYQVTEGNPFFIEEVCKGLAERGALVHRDGRWHVVGGRDLGIPVNVKVAIAGRLAGLPAETREVLETASIRGREFEFDVLQRAMGWRATALGDALEMAERAQIIEKLPGEDGRRYAFTHSLIPAAMVDGMRSSRKRELHGRVAPVLEALRPDEYETLAHQYRAAGDLVKASSYFLKAGERAYALYALPETVDNYRAALELLTDLQRDEDAALTWLRLGLVYSADFQFDRAGAAYERAFDLGEQIWRSEVSSATAAPGAVLRYAVDEPLTLDPGMAGDDPSCFILGQLFEGLLEVDEAGGVVPALARRWDVSDDGRRYTFHLRQGAQWSDGSALTAGDFEYAWKRNLQLGPSSPAPLLLGLLAHARAYVEGRASADEVGVRAVDDRTLEVQLEQPAAFFPLLLTHAVTYPLPQRVVAGDRQPWTEVEHLVGNGPFRLGEWRRGEKLAFERNPFYRGLARGNVGRIEAPVITEYDPVLRMFDAQQIDGVSLIASNPGTVHRLRAAYPTDFAFVPSLSTFFLAFRTDRPPFEATPVRLAFAHAIDREAFVGETGAAHLRAAHGGFLPPGMPGHTASIGLPYDPTAARRLLADAGYAGGAGFPHTELIFAGERSASASFLQRVWKDTLGVDVQLKGVEWGEFLRRRDADPADLSISAWSADYPDPDNMLRVLFHSREGLNAIRWRQATFDALIEEAARITDRKRRLELYQEADRILVAEEAAVLPLGYAQGRQLVKPYVRLPRTPPSLLRLKHAVVDRQTDQEDVKA